MRVDTFKIVRGVQAPVCPMQHRIVVPGVITVVSQTAIIACRVALLPVSHYVFENRGEVLRFNTRARATAGRRCRCPCIADFLPYFVLRTVDGRVWLIAVIGIWAVTQLQYAENYEQGCQTFQFCFPHYYLYSWVPFEIAFYLRKISTNTLFYYY